VSTASKIAIFYTLLDWNQSFWNLYSVIFLNEINMYAFFHYFVPILTYLVAVLVTKNLLETKTTGKHILNLSKKCCILVVKNFLYLLKFIDHVPFNKDQNQNTEYVFLSELHNMSTNFSSLYINFNQGKMLTKQNSRYFSSQTNGSIFLLIFFFLYFLLLYEPRCKSTPHLFWHLGEASCFTVHHHPCSVLFMCLSQSEQVWKERSWRKFQRYYRKCDQPCCTSENLACGFTSY
jgi:hypothetical protein